MICSAEPHVRCLSCGNIYPLSLGEKCPQRYLSPHTEEHNKRVVVAALALGWKPEECMTEEIHQKAIEKACMIVE